MMPSPTSLYTSILLLLAVFTVPSLSQVNATTQGANYTTLDIYWRYPSLYFNGTVYNGSYPYRQIRVAYRNLGGLAVVENDVILGTVADVQAAAVSNGPPPPVKNKRALSIWQGNARQKWPRGYFPYKYDSDATRTKRDLAFKAAIKLWTDRLPFLRFVEVSAPNPTLEPNGGPITLVDYEKECPDCSASPLGRAIKQDGTYDAARNKMILGNCYSFTSCAAVYAHEIGHSESGLPSCCLHSTNNHLRSWPRP